MSSVRPIASPEAMIDAVREGDIAYGKFLGGKAAATAAPSSTTQVGSVPPTPRPGGGIDKGRQ